MARWVMVAQVKIIRSELQNWGYETLGKAKPSLVEQMHSLLTVEEKEDDSTRSGWFPLQLRYQN